MKTPYLLASILVACGVVAAGRALVKHCDAPPSSVQARITAASAPVQSPASRAIRTEVTAKSVESNTAAGSVRASSAKPARRAEPAPAPAQGGMIIVMDEENGGFAAPTPQQARALTGMQLEATSRADDGLVPFEGVRGGIGVDLQGRFQDHATIAIGADGKKHFGCVHAGAHGAACVDSIPAPRVLEER